MILAPGGRLASGIDRFIIWTLQTPTVALTSASNAALGLKTVSVRLVAILLVSACFLGGASVPPSPIAVRHKEGSVHGFLLLSNLDGTALAEGDVAQVPDGDRITNRLTYQFKDGSRQEETTIFSQRESFRLISYHLAQKGPAFPHPIDLSIATSTGQVMVQYTDGDGKGKTAAERLKLPPDLANGLVPTLLKNIRPDTPLTEVSMVVATPKPRLVKLAITGQGSDAFSVAGSRREALHYIVKIEIGSIAGLLAPLLGKEPPDTHVWILGGEAPAFVKSEGASFLGGPIWRTELASPVWPRAAASDSKDDGSQKH
jgi:hypothetical protein